jgi:hypothetical protein
VRIGYVFGDDRILRLKLQNQDCGVDCEVMILVKRAWSVVLMRQLRLQASGFRLRALHVTAPRKYLRGDFTYLSTEPACLFCKLNQVTALGRDSNAWLVRQNVSLDEPRLS